MRQPATFIRQVLDREMKRQAMKEEAERQAAAKRAEQIRIQRMLATNERTLRSRLHISPN